MELIVMIPNQAIRKLLIIAVFGLSFAYLTKTEHQRRICTTEDCLRSATALVESMNKSVDPCEDFYQFACGNFAKLHKIPKTAISNDRFAETHAATLILIRDFLEKDDSDTECYSVSKSRLLYRSCMATDKMNTDGIKQLVQILDKIGLPYMGLSSRTKSISAILARLKKQINLDYLFVTNVEADTKNRSTNRISLGKPRDTNIFPVHKITEHIKKMSSRKMRETLASEEEVGNTNDSEEYAEGIDYLKSYAKYFKGVCTEIYKFQSNDFDPSFRTYGIKVSQLLNFINEHSKIKDEIYDKDDELPSVMTVDELQNYTNHITRNFTKSNEQIIDWKEYFTILFMDVENVTLDFETDLIQISNIEYFEALFELISKHKNQAKINIWWEVVVTLLPYTTNEMRFIQDRFYYETTGLENNPSRSLYCANAVNSMMGMAVSRLLLDIESIYNNTKMAAEMIENIHWAFEKIVKELNWMDDITKLRTLYKAQQMTTFIGFPEFINDPVQLDEYYSEFEVIENDYFGNVILYVQQDLNNSLLGLRQLNNYTINSWASDPLEVNAYNWIQANAITVPAGILQFPFFGHDLQMLNYGFLGSILGHELTHGFDNTGRKFDHDGNENMWWTNKTIAEYEKRTDCFIHHYGSYLVPDIEEKISGKMTLDENIADNGGLREALLAYRKFVHDFGEEPKLPGFEQYSNEQMYYLAFANNWCEATTRESLSNSILDEHSPNSIRVIAGLTNSDEFSEVWKCEKGSGMNPKNDKCKIW
ncbi:endothelin-converting enzyme homolog isoform X2 [Myzus persicae]|uniref:endothelin-converting enzyme homolog isoform X2 n=1 Tax=Myzus persicae TaxID=13164 RepID=UPI000B935B29|nr:endothelin-converting enzyme homolog isoform X2 [Myzus persicae]XP_022173801.1 endothelin-converting enzyme homolog isoform X2 [Myzus persicae]XP_022173802.1 endothelin-converting enzyme homolog isoform X2 [Myzus persicae]XP_022173803.1 endothelin-converting enzyme homolog isoform X2 [Myzus persicae]XP_022173804.1 endothelin-converting enzyme homolog isoform X2 [Myzus persicae]